ncbi:GNAT family N-acetyltransferase [Tenacibaculum sp. 190130A14a]|uniref:GNAT family N-acetyltransferase n=1 Tax=Tenacibaculum polynesiense TaxID=3137857 RepID=A0ABM9PBP1_9FLAO
MGIRKATLADYDAVWNIFSRVIQTGDTYVFNPNTPKRDLAKHWFANYMETFVYEEGVRVLGTYIIKANQLDLGNHVANASYMIHPEAQGKGIGKQLCEHSLETARNSGFKAMQFNIVVSTNIGAVKLWERFGFKIIGTTPNGFRHVQLGFVDTYIMHRSLIT